MSGDAAQPGVQPAVEVSGTNGLRSESGPFSETNLRSGDEPHNRVALCNLRSGWCSAVKAVRETGWSHDDSEGKRTSLSDCLGGSDCGAQR